MRRTHGALLAGAAAMLTLGLLAGSVIGDDGSAAVAERIAGAEAAPIVQTATLGGGKATSAAKKRRRAKKPKVAHGFGQVIEVAAEGNSTASLACTKKFPVPISAGLDTSVPRIFPGRIMRDPDRKRAMLISVVNITDADAEWLPTIACMKGVKEV